MKHAASVEVTDNRQKTVLHYAAGSGAPESVGLILKAIRRLETTETCPRNSLVEAADDKGRTPFNYTTRMNLLAHAQLLIENGARLEAKESKSKRTTPLNAIYWNSHDVLPVLLKRGAQTNVRDASGAALLHHVAWFGDLRTLQIMVSNEIGRIDPDLVDHEGLTALDIFNSTNARCRPKDSIERELAARVFRSIIQHSTQLRSINQRVTDNDENDREKGGMEEGYMDPLGGDSDQCEASAELSDSDDIFHDAVSDFDLNLA